VEPLRFSLTLSAAALQWVDRLIPKRKHQTPNKFFAEVIHMQRAFIDKSFNTCKLNKQINSSNEQVN